MGDRNNFRIEQNRKDAKFKLVVYWVVGSKMHKDLGKCYPYYSHFKPSLSDQAQIDGLISRIFKCHNAVIRKAYLLDNQTDKLLEIVR